MPFLVNGRRIEVQVFCHAIRNEQHEGPPLGYVGALLEVTAETKYTLHLDKHLPAGIYTLDAEDNVVRANDGFAKLVGYVNAADIVGMNAGNFYADPRLVDHVKARATR